MSSYRIQRRGAPTSVRERLRAEEERRRLQRLRVVESCLAKQGVTRANATSMRLIKRSSRKIRRGPGKGRSIHRKGWNDRPVTPKSRFQADDSVTRVRRTKSDPRPGENENFAMSLRGEDHAGKESHMQVRRRPKHHRHQLQQKQKQKKSRRNLAQGRNTNWTRGGMNLTRHGRVKKKSVRIGPNGKQQGGGENEEDENSRAQSAPGQPRHKPRRVYRGSSSLQQARKSTSAQGTRTLRRLPLEPVKSPFDSNGEAGASPFDPSKSRVLDPCVGEDLGTIDPELLRSPRDASPAAFSGELGGPWAEGVGLDLSTIVESAESQSFMTSMILSPAVEDERQQSLKPIGEDWNGISSGSNGSSDSEDGTGGSESDEYDDDDFDVVDSDGGGQGDGEPQPAKDFSEHAPEVTPRVTRRKAEEGEEMSPEQLAGGWRIFHCEKPNSAISKPTGHDRDSEYLTSCPTPHMTVGFAMTPSTSPSTSTSNAPASNSVGEADSQMQIATSDHKQPGEMRQDDALVSQSDVQARKSHKAISAEDTSADVSEWQRNIAQSTLASLKSRALQVVADSSGLDLRRPSTKKAEILGLPKTWRVGTAKSVALTKWARFLKSANPQNLDLRRPSKRRQEHIPESHITGRIAPDSEPGSGPESDPEFEYTDGDKNLEEKEGDTSLVVFNDVAPLDNSLCHDNADLSACDNDAYDSDDYVADSFESNSLDDVVLPSQPLEKKDADVGSKCTATSTKVGDSNMDESLDYYDDEDFEESLEENNASPGAEVRELAQLLTGTGLGSEVLRRLRNTK